MPSDPKSQQNSLDTEFLKLERTLDSVTADASSHLRFYHPVGFETWTQIDVDDGFTILSSDNGAQASFDVTDPVGRFIWGNADGTIWGNLGYYNTVTSRISFIASTPIEFDQVPYVNTDEVLTSATGIVKNTQAAIANDASGAANQATVNAILAALRVHNIIAP